MSKAHLLTHRKKVLSQDVAGVPLNFLLGATNRALDDYELARFAAIADLRTQIQELLDKLNQEGLPALCVGFAGMTGRLSRLQSKTKKRRKNEPSG